MIRHVIAAVLMSIGVVCTGISLFGVFRFRYVMNRMHCAAVIDTLGMGCILLGLILWSGSIEYIPKLLAVAAILWVGSPIASHLVARMEIAADASATRHMEQEDDIHGNI